jgi:hypothetical protein
MKQRYEIFLSSTTVHTGSGVRRAFYSMVSFPDLSWPGRAVDLSHFFSAEVKNNWSYTFAVPPNTPYDVARDNFTFCS